MTEEQKNAGECPTFYYLLALTILGSGAYWLCAPYGAVIFIIGASGLRSPLQRGAVFWAPKAAYFIGALWGVGFATLTTALSHFAFHALWSRIAFASFVLGAVANLGCGTSSRRIYVPSWEEKVVVAQVVGMLCYVPLIALGMWLLA